MKSTNAEPLVERARTLICEHLLAHGYQEGIDPIWLARLLVARLTLKQLLNRLRRNPY